MAGKETSVLDNRGNGKKALFSVQHSINLMGWDGDGVVVTLCKEKCDPLCHSLFDFVFLFCTTEKACKCLEYRCLFFLCKGLSFIHLFICA